MGKQEGGRTRGRVAVMFAVAFMLSPVGPAGAQDDARTRLQGTFVNEAQSQSAEAIRKAIDAAVAKMNFVTRPIARGRLKKANVPHRRVEIARTEQEISVTFDSYTPVRMPADGRTAKWTRDDGETFEVSASWRGESLVQTFKGEDGQRTNTFSLGPDAGTLTVQVEVTSPRLPAPVQYALAFTRK
jgi:hypothetical protein